MSVKTIDIQALESILSFIIKNPDTVEITRKVDEMGVLLILKVDRADMGVVIGRNGEMANSIKKYIKKVGQVNNMNIRLRIDEPAGSDETYTPEVKETKQASSQKEEAISDVSHEDLQDFTLN
jgi:uncharacterized protein